MAAGAIAIGAAQAIASGVTAGMNAREAKKARHWSKKMYKHRYQYTMADMAEAGLNPILAAKLGAGSVPSAAQAKLDMDLGSAVKSGLAVRRQKQELVNMSATAEATRQQGIASATQAQQNAAMTAKTNREAELLTYQVPKSQAEAKFWGNVGQWGNVAKAAGGIVGGATLLGGSAKIAGGLYKAYKNRKKLNVGKDIFKKVQSQARKYDLWPN